MGLTEFINQLKDLGYEPEVEGNRVKFEYEVPHGRFKDQVVILGLEIPDDFPLTPPSGPHISPRILPLNPGAASHPEKVVESPFGPEWEYWSRPFTIWGDTSRTVEDYITRHIFHLFDQ